MMNNDENDDDETRKIKEKYQGTIKIIRMWTHYDGLK